MYHSLPYYARRFSAITGPKRFSRNNSDYSLQLHLYLAIIMQNVHCGFISLAVIIRSVHYSFINLAVIIRTVHSSYINLAVISQNVHLSYIDLAVVIRMFAKATLISSDNADCSIQL